jgi:hypothetical protein
MPFVEGLSLTKYAIEQEQEERLYNTWLHGYNQTLSYSEFKEQNAQTQIQDNETVGETLEKVKRILKTTVKEVQ